MSKPFIEAKANVSPLVIVREFGIDCPVTCALCGHDPRLRLYSDEALETAECEELLEVYLREHGWRVEGSEQVPRDICPACAPADDRVDSGGR